MLESRSIRLFVVLSIFLLLSAVVGCTSSQIRYHQQQLSQDYTYIDFTENSTPLSIIAEVGGEHMSFYKVIAFYGDRFKICVIPLEGKPAATLSGDGVTVKESADEGFLQWVVQVDATEVFITIDFSAHPYGRYTLLIEKL